MIYLKLFWEFLKIGLFAVGGGMATVPFLQRMSVTTGWFPQSLITDMIAISESTPGPIGINMATYVGYNIAGILGGVLATLGETIPSIVIVVIVSRELERYRGSRMVEDAFYGLRPAVTALIAAAFVGIVKSTVLCMEQFLQSRQILDLVDWKKLIFFGLAFFAIRKFKKHPVVYIAVAAVVGIVFAF